MLELASYSLGKFVSFEKATRWKNVSGFLTNVQSTASRMVAGFYLIFWITLSFHEKPRSLEFYTADTYRVITTM